MALSVALRNLSGSSRIVNTDGLFDPGPIQEAGKDVKLLSVTERLLEAL
jgi:hypothetical protein